MTEAPKNSATGFWNWFLENSLREDAHKISRGPEGVAPWWKVMCLTGVEYFSTLGYQPSIAFLAAGLLSPIATFFLVLMTLFGALPVYSRVARVSPHGQGSVALLEDLFPGWHGKWIVLVLLGFAATDFIITITLSAADASAHAVSNPLMAAYLPGKLPLTLLLLSVLGGVFLLGFRAAIWLSMLLVVVYMGLNTAILTVSSQEIINHPELLSNWSTAILAQNGHSWLSMIGLSVLLFPKVALGLAGFETGVSVMPLIEGDDQDTEEEPVGRIRNTRYLLFTVAAVMSVFLILSALETTLLIPAEAFQAGGEANGRALSYLAHKYLGSGFGTVFDISSIGILWFAGASAMTGLLTLAPRYLPAYGMAPEWAGSVRPLVVFFTIVSFIVTFVFLADVDAQAGAYATGVMFLFAAAAFAVLLLSWKEGIFKRIYFGAVCVIFLYTLVSNIIARPEGIHIATFFVVTILISSVISRALRSFELRISNVILDETAEKFIRDSKGNVRIVAHRPGGSTNFQNKEQEAFETHNLRKEEIIFLEVKLGDASEFRSDVLYVSGEQVDRFRIMKCESPAVPNAIAALLLHIRDVSGEPPHIYLGWTEGSPVVYVMRFLFLGEGETAPVTREILREVEPSLERRPYVHVG